MKKIYTGTILSLAAALLISGSDANADPRHDDRGGPGNGRPNDIRHDARNDNRHADPRPERRVIVDRNVINNYYVQNRWRFRCPPGLAKKRGYCVPPRYYRRYEIGAYFPGDYYEPLPYGLILDPAPYGTRYVYYDNDVYLIDDATRLILDAVFYPR